MDEKEIKAEEEKKEEKEIKAEEENKAEEEVKEEGSNVADKAENTTESEEGESVSLPENELLEPLETYLSNGIHVGLVYKTKDMQPFIYKRRADRLYLFDIQSIDERIRIGAKFISRINPGDLLVVSNKVYAKKAIKKFADYLGCDIIEGHIPSGMFTNPNIKGYREPKAIIVSDTLSDRQAIAEAKKAGVTVIALCDTNARIKNIDFVIPCNNKGKTSIALVYWLLIREIMKIKGVEGFNATINDFISDAEPQEYLVKMHEIQRRQNRKKRNIRGRKRKRKKKTQFMRR